MCGLLRNWNLDAQLSIPVGDGTVTLKGSHRMVDGRIFLENLRASLFNDDLSNEPNFGWIHLVGQYIPLNNMVRSVITGLSYK